MAALFPRQPGHLDGKGGQLGICLEQRKGLGSGFLFTVRVIDEHLIEAAQRQMNPALVGKGAKGQSVLMGRGRWRSRHLRDGE